MAALGVQKSSGGCSAPSGHCWVWRGLQGGVTGGLAFVPSISGAHGARAGRDAAAWQSGSSSRSWGAAPAGNGCGLSPPRPGAGTELCRARGSPEGEQIQPGQPNPWMGLGWMLQAGVALGWQLLASQIQLWGVWAWGQPQSQAVKSCGCPPSSVPIRVSPWSAGLVPIPIPGPAPEQWLGKPRVWSQGRERSRACSKSFQWFNCCGRAGERLPRLPWG